MIPLDISFDLERHPWEDVAVTDENYGHLTHVGLIRAGTFSGKASVALVVTLPTGEHYIGETTWALLFTAYRAMAASLAIAEEVIAP